MSVHPCDVKCPLCGAGLADVPPDWEVSELLAGRLSECFAHCDRGHHVHAVRKTGAVFVAGVLH